MAEFVNGNRTSVIRACIAVGAHSKGIPGVEIGIHVGELTGSTAIGDCGYGDQVGAEVGCLGPVMLLLLIENFRLSYTYSLSARYSAH